MTRGLRPGLGLAALVIVLFAFWFGSASTGAGVIADHTVSMDTYLLMSLYERAGHYVAQGDLPLWMPEYEAGYPAPAAWMYGLLYPGAGLFALLPGPLAWTWTAILHLAFAALGMYGFVHEDRRCVAGALAAGVAFATSEFLVGRFLAGHQNLVWPLAWAPWIGWTALRAVRGARWGLTGLAATTALGLLSGHAQLWFYLGPVLAVFALARAARTVDRRAALIRVLSGGALGLLLAAAQWTQTLAFVGLAGDPPPRTELFAWCSLPTHAISAKLFPGAYGYRPDTFWGDPHGYEHEFVGIAGLALLLLVVLALTRRSRERIVWAVVAVFGLMLAQGAYTAPSVFFTNLPVLSWARAPARAQVLTVLAVCWLVGQAVADWYGTPGTDEGTRPARRPLWVASVVAGVFGIAGSVHLLAWAGDHAQLEGHLGTLVPALLWGWAFAAAMVGALLLGKRTAAGAWAPAAVLLLAALFGGMPPASTVAAEAFYEADWLGTLPEDVRARRINVDAGVIPNIERQGGKSFRRLSHVDAPWYQTFREQQSPEAAFWLDMALEVQQVPRDRLMAGEFGPRDQQLRRFETVGDGLLMNGAREAPDDEALTALMNGEQGLIVTPQDADLVPAGGLRREVVGTVRAIATADPCRVAYDVDARADGLLFVSEKAFPGWEAEVDGEPAPIARVNVMFRGVRVPAGRHRVTMTYRPVAFRVGLGISLLSLLGLGLLVHRERRRAPVTAEPAA